MDEYQDIIVDIWQFVRDLQNGASQEHFDIVQGVVPQFECPDASIDADVGIGQGKCA